MNPRHPLDPNTTVTIMGLGLMGGSLALALRRHAARPRLIGVVRTHRDVEEAQHMRVVDHVTTNWKAAVREADIVILATPVRTLLRHISMIGPYLKEHTLVLDVGSTKTQICAAMAALPPHVQPIGGHPMCGKEVSGLAHAEAELYEGATFILCPLERTAPWALDLALNLVHQIGAQPLILSPEHHDRLVATVSHLPYLLAAALVGTAHRVAQDDPRVWKIAAGGFRDTSRVASSNLDMMLDILMTNRDAVLDMVDHYLAEFTELRTLLEQEDEGALRLYLANIKNLRDAHFGKGRT